MRRLRALPLLALLWMGAARATPSGDVDPTADLPADAVPTDAVPTDAVDALAAEPPVAAAVPDAAPRGASAAAATPASTLPIRVLSVEPARAQLGDTVTLTVQNLPALLDRVDGDCTALVLFLGDLPLAKTPPVRCDPDDGHVGFILSRTDDSELAWHRLLGRPRALTREVTATIGSSTTRSYPRAAAASLDLVVIPIGRFVTFWVAAVLGLGGIVWLGARSPMLRVPAGGSRLAPLDRPFSLSRAQQAFWVVLAVLGYTFVWLMTDELHALSASVLGLIGISAVTALGSEIIDGTKVQTMAQQLKKLRADRTAAETRAAAAARDGGPTPEGRAAEERMATAGAEIADVELAIQQRPSAGFLVDVLSDPQGISLQRVQVAIWTVVLGCIFIYEVYARLTMPDFDPTLLALMGISSGSFLAGKSTENPVVPGAASPPPADPPPDGAGA